MKRGIVSTALISLVVLGCENRQQQLKVTYLSDPPGGTLYRQNGELWGPCPKVLWYDLDEEALAAGQLQAKGLIARWPSGPEEKSADMITFPVDGTDQEFTFVQPQDVPGDRRVPGPPDRDAAAVPKVTSEQDPGLLEEPDEQTPPTKQTAKIAEPVDDITEEKDDSAQARSEVIPGLREEPDEVNVQTSSAATIPNPEDGIVERQARAGSNRDSVGDTGERQASAPRPKPELIPEPPEDPNEEVIHAKVETVTVNLGDGVLIEFAMIPAGESMMGAGLDGQNDESDENPTQSVMISQPFYMSVYEVTQEQYEKVVGANPSRFRGSKRPVETVSWNDARGFCRRLSQQDGTECRLPTEAEWEYACRAGTTTAYYWGDNFDDRYAWSLADRKASTQDVGTKLPNAWGLYDMSGNVWEWCSDSYGERDKSRVLRGGSWGHGRLNCRSAHRNWHTPNHRYDDCGFRIVMEIEPPPEPPPSP
jgi:formylglycine-generating enzyme required for sulfatase activity